MVFHVFDDFIWNAYKKIKTNKKNNPGISLKQHHDYKEKIYRRKHFFSTSFKHLIHIMAKHLHFYHFTHVTRELSFSQVSMVASWPHPHIPLVWQLSTNYQSVNNEENEENKTPTVFDGYTHWKTMWTSLKKCIVAANISLPTAGLGRDPTLKINIWFSALVVCQLVGHFFFYKLLWNILVISLWFSSNHFFS